MVDADCVPSAGAIELLALECARTSRPAQAHYRMELPDNPSLEQKLGAFAWRVRNFIRPIGLARLQLPCNLMGSGMAFPWALMRDVRLATNNLVEDALLGLELAAIGRPPIFCPQASVNSVFPVTDAAIVSQRQRWEVGSLRLMWSELPSKLAIAVVGRNMGILVLALDLCVPPVAVLAFFTFLGFSLCLALSLVGWENTAVWVFCGAAVTLTFTLGLAYSVFATDVIKLREFRAAPAYFMRKFRILRPWMSGRELEWKKTDRR